MAKQVKGTKTPRSTAGRRKLHAGTFVHDEAYDEEQHDCGPWVSTPKSSRVDSFRYDYQNTAVQVRWHGKGDSRAYIYLDVPYEVYTGFVRAKSKGQYINTSLNNFDYRLMTADELGAPSNDDHEVGQRGGARRATATTRAPKGP